MCSHISRRTKLFHVKRRAKPGGSPEGLTPLTPPCPSIGTDCVPMAKGSAFPTQTPFVAEGLPSQSIDRRILQYSLGWALGLRSSRHGKPHNQNIDLSL